MKAQHTPGPWMPSWRDYGGVIDKDGYVVAQAATFRNKEVIEANARLIAAAPDLLEALQDCVSVMSIELKGLAVIQPELRNAMAAIAKATGSDAARDEGGL